MEKWRTEEKLMETDRERKKKKDFTQAFPDALGLNDVDGGSPLPFVSSYFEEALQSPSLPLSLRWGHSSKIATPQKPQYETV